MQVEKEFFEVVEDAKVMKFYADNKLVNIYEVDEKGNVVRNEKKAFTIYTKPDGEYVAFYIKVNDQFHKVEKTSRGNYYYYPHLIKGGK